MFFPKAIQMVPNQQYLTLLEPSKQIPMCGKSKSKQRPTYTVKNYSATDTTPCATCDAPMDPYELHTNTNPYIQKTCVFAKGQNSWFAAKLSKWYQINNISPFWSQTNTNPICGKSKSENRPTHTIKKNTHKQQKIDAARTPTDP